MLKKIIAFASLIFISFLEADTNASQLTLEAIEIANNCPDAILFNPPENWKVADSKLLPASVKVMVVGNGKSDFPPSINLGYEKHGGNLKNYLKMVKAINDAQGADWKDLGTIRTQAGNASLSQVDVNSEWGPLRMMHVILVKDGFAYILTAAALKVEFSLYYKEFFQAMRSLRFNQDVFQVIPKTADREKLRSADLKLKSRWKNLLRRIPLPEDLSLQAFYEEAFNNNDFQEKHWKPYKEMIMHDYHSLGNDWQNRILEKTKNDLLEALEKRAEKK